MESVVIASLKLEFEIQERVERLAAVRQRSADWIVREAIREYVTREEKREQFRLDTLGSWEDYQATGLHVSQDEMETWISQLEAGDDTLPPKCHV
jgi:predicted transcriptional regulator